MNTKSIGDRTEAIVLAELLKVGYTVLLPFGDNQRYDMVIDESGSFRRIQCKTARLANDGDVLIFKTSSTYAHRGRPQRGYLGDADLFAVYAPSTDQVYIIPVEGSAGSAMSIRLTPPRNGHQANIKYAKDFLLAKWQEDHSGVA
jgi:hypothetical protein